MEYTFYLSALIEKCNPYNVHFSNIDNFNSIKVDSPKSILQNHPFLTIPTASPKGIITN